MLNIYSMREILTGKDRVVSFQSLIQTLANIGAVFVCYRKEFDIWKIILSIIILNIFLIWFQSIFNHALNRIYLDRYNADVAQQAEELASMVTQKKIFKKTVIKDVLEKLAEEDDK